MLTVIASVLVVSVNREIGFPVSNMPAYLSGEKREVLLNYPELLYYRDVVFMFKFMMTPTNAALPEIRTWMQTDADLQWKYNSEKNEYEVRAFDQILSCAPPIDPDEEKKARESQRVKGSSVASGGCLRRIAGLGRRVRIRVRWRVSMWRMRRTCCT